LRATQQLAPETAEEVLFPLSTPLARLENVMSLLDKVFSGKPSQADFAEIVTSALHKAGINRDKVDQSESDFSLKLPGGATIFLGNVYANFCSAPRSARHSILSEFIAPAASVPDLPSIPSDFATLKPSLMPVIRDAASFSIERLINRKNGKDAAPCVPPFGGGDMWTVDGMGELIKPLARGLVVGLAYDAERTITSIYRDHFEEWGVSLEEAFKAAKDNLWERTDPNRFAGRNGVYWGEWADSYDSSRILLTELIYRLSIDGDPIAFVPSRDQFVVTGSNNSAGLASILESGIENHFNQGHPLSPDLYVLVDGNWKVYVPEDKSLREMWMKIRRRRDAIDYAEQQKLLNEIHEIEDIDIFVASYKIYERKDGFAYSACVWTSGIDSSLPRSENIAFMADVENPDYFVVPWEAAESVVGNLLELEPDLAPARYRARQFPSDEQLAKLRPLAI
jgi:hypothetical protein